MHLSLVYRGDTEGANKFLQVQNDVFVNEVETNE